jgi:hypothetical protein
MILILLLLISIYTITIELVYSGHEVIYKYKLKSNDIKPSELAIIQFDSRELIQGSYWLHSVSISLSLYLSIYLCIYLCF